MQEEQRSMMRFDGAIKAAETRRKYTFYLNKFLEFAKMKEADGLLQLKDHHLETTIEDYVLYMRKKVSPNSIPIMFAPIELFFVMNDKNLNFKRIRKLFPQTVKKAGFVYQDLFYQIRYSKATSVCKFCNSSKFSI